MMKTPRAALDCAFAIAILGMVLGGVGSVTLAQQAPPAKPSESIQWRSFAPSAFRAAQASDRLILLVLDVPWSTDVLEADQHVWNDPAVVRAVSERFIAVRERADLRPDLARRYPVRGWPSVTLLLPDGSALFYQSEKVPTPYRMSRGRLPAAEMVKFLEAGSVYYRGARGKAISLANEQQQKADHALLPGKGEVTRELYWSIAHRMKIFFDKEHRYFGGPPRLPQPDLIELMFSLSAENDEGWKVLAEFALESFYKGLHDTVEGGICRMARNADWSDRQPEKLLDVNARTLDLLTLAYRRGAQGKWRRRAIDLAGFLTGKLGLEDGSFASAMCSACPGGRDETVLSGENGLAAAALIRAGAALEEPALVERGLAAAAFLKNNRYRAGRGVPRVVDGSGKGAAGVYDLDDQADVAWAFIAAWEVSGDRSYLEAARDLARTAIASLRDEQAGGLRDRVPTPSGPVPLRHSQVSLVSNSHMVRVLVRLYYYSGRKEKIFRSAALDLLEAFGESHDKVMIQMPSYGLAAYEYYSAPMIAVVVGPNDDVRGDQLRRAALGSDFPFTLVMSLNNEQNRDQILAAGFSIQTTTGLHPFYEGLSRFRIGDPAVVRAGLYDLRLLRVEQRQAAGEPKEDLSRYRVPLTR